MDVDKLETVPSDLGNLSNEADNNIAKKTVYNQLVIKVSAIDTLIPSRLVTKTQYDSDKNGFGKNIEDVDRKVPNTNGLVRKTDY